MTVQQINLAAAELRKPQWWGPWLLGALPFWLAALMVVGR